MMLNRSWCDRDVKGINGNRYLNLELDVVDWGHDSNLRKARDFEATISSAICSKLGADKKRASHH